MKKQFVLFLFFLSGISYGQTLLLECGQNSGRNFNGWFVDNHHPFDAIEFDAHSVAFEHWLGGNFPVSLTKKVEAIKDFDSIRLLFNFEEVRDCKVEDVTYYVSEDGKKWKPIQSSRNNVALAIPNPKHTIQYVRAVANTRFDEDGRVALNYVKIEGEQNPIQNSELTELIREEPIENFFIFNFENNINIETNTSAEYDVLITSTTGKIVFRDSYIGSNRIELPHTITNGFYIVAVIQDNAFKASKKVMF